LSKAEGHLCSAEFKAYDFSRIFIEKHTLMLRRTFDPKKARADWFSKLVIISDNFSKSSRFFTGYHPSHPPPSRLLQQRKLLAASEMLSNFLPSIKSTENMTSTVTG
jgi:hypothetical protein